MDALQHFAANSLIFVQITYIHNNKNIPPYALAYHVFTPTFKLPKSHIHRNSRLPRYYLNKKCLNNPWRCRKIGPLYIPQHLKNEDVQIGNVICIDAKHKTKGLYGLSYLPPSWSTPLTSFFQYYSIPLRVRCMLQTNETKNLLKQHLYINFHKTIIPTLYYALVCLVTKNFYIIIDMLKFPRLRKTDLQTLEDIKNLNTIKAFDCYIPNTIEFVIELAFWKQDPEFLKLFANQLSTEIEKNPTNFKKQAKNFLISKDKTIKYMKRVLKQLARDSQ